jgi:hypothetical protein
MVMLAGGLLLSAQCIATQKASPLPATLKAELTNNKGVYVKPIARGCKPRGPYETWFVYQNGAVYVPSPTAGPRARSIRQGSTEASITVGQPDGPSFTATGAILKPAEVSPSIFVDFQKKYPERWALFGGLFRAGFTDGTRVLIKYTPKDS